MRTFTKDILRKSLLEIRELGWVQRARPGIAGAVGNTLEDLLGIEENNLPLPNAAEWELKTQRADTSSLTTLFHMEPSPRAMKMVARVLLPNYGWPHDKAGVRYPDDEMSFRQTISGVSRSDRGFTVLVNRRRKKIEVSFDASFVSNRHAEWLESVKTRAGLGELNPMPYWGFNDLFHKAGTKLHNTFFILAERKREDGSSIFDIRDFSYCKGCV